MTTESAVKAFMSQPALAVVGVSRNKNKFGSIVYRDPKGKGYRVYAVNPNAQMIDGDPAYPDLFSLPEAVGGVVLIVKPEVTERMVEQAKQAGITRVWMQPGAESPAAAAYCEANGIAAVLGECIMMFAGPVRFPHSIHRWVNKVSGKLPK